MRGVTNGGWNTPRPPLPGAGAAATGL